MSQGVLRRPGLDALAEAVVEQAAHDLRRADARKKAAAREFLAQMLAGVGCDATRLSELEG